MFYYKDRLAQIQAVKKFSTQVLTSHLLIMRTVPYSVSNDSCQFGMSYFTHRLAQILAVKRISTQILNFHLLIMGGLG